MSRVGAKDRETGAIYYVDDQAYVTDDKLYRCTTEHTSGATFAGDIANWTIVANTINYVSVGTSGADYDNFDDAIDYLQANGGGVIEVLTNMTIGTSTKDISNITFIGNKFYSGSVQISKPASGGYWYGNHMCFKNLWFYRMADSGANEIIRFTEAYQVLELTSVNVMGIGAMGSPATINCNSLEVHIKLSQTILGIESETYEGVSNYGSLTLYLFNNSNAYITGTLDVVSRDSSGVLYGSPTVTSGNNLVDIAEGVSYDNTTSGLTADNVQDAIDEVNSLTLDCQVTKTIYVDNNRTDTYTETGNIGTPFKTIAAAIAVASDGDVLDVQAGTYTENVVLPAGVSFINHNANKVVINGNFTITAGANIGVRGVNFSSGYTLTVNASTSFIDCYSAGAVIVNDVVIQAYNFHIVSSVSGVTALTVNGASAKFQSVLATISSSGDVPTIIQNNGSIILNSIAVYGARAGTVISSVGGYFVSTASQVINSSGGTAMDLQNGATATTPNMISDTYAVGNTVCGAIVTLVEGLQFGTVGSLSGTAISYRKASMLSNDSTVDGDTVKNALDNLDIAPVVAKDDTDAASSSNVGTLRYRLSGNNSYVDMSMQTGAATYARINILQNNR